MEAPENLSAAAPAPRDPASISPSAYALLMMKSHTSIPFVREAAALVDPAQFSDLSAGIDIDPMDYWTRVLHFESRYWSINQLLEELPATNILEISSGFSFRGLDLSYKKPVFYIDTDLPNIIAGKQRFVDALTAPAGSPLSGSANSPSSVSPAPLDAPGPAGSPASASANSPAAAPPAASPVSASPARPGHYELQPLNALDPIAFEAVVNKFPPGPLTIVNEGLMVYLDPAEKAQLCANIRKALLTRGGSRWITADIYIKRDQDDAGMRSDAWRNWSREHGLEEKKFASFEEAETFFHSMGFEIEKEATQDYSRLTSFAQFLKAVGSERLNELRRSGRPRTHATWLLAPKG